MKIRSLALAAVTVAAIVGGQFATTGSASAATLASTPATQQAVIWLPAVQKYAAAEDAQPVLLLPAVQSAREAAR